MVYAFLVLLFIGDWHIKYFEQDIKPNPFPLEYIAPKSD